MEPLFTPIVKHAGAATPLPEDPANWPQEILQQVFKQAPYIADFHPQVEMQQVDAERAYAIGHVEVRNSTEIPLQQTTPAAAEAAGIRRVRIPIIVKEGKLLPLDLLLSEGGKIMPLTPERLRAALFRPQVFDVTSRPPGDQSLVGQLYPPNRQFYGFGGGGTVDVGAGAKTASLTAVATAAGENALLKLASYFQTPEARFSIATNAGLRRALEKVATSPLPVTKKEAALITLGMIRPTVVQITPSEGRYTVKTANYQFWAPFTYEVDRGQLFREFGGKIAMEVDTSGGATITEKTQEQPVAPVPMGPITSAGFYEVESEMGEPLQGYVIPNTLDINATSLPIALFLGMDGQIAVEKDVVGRAIDPVPLNLHYAHHPEGFGFFARESDNGSLEATAPLTLKASIKEQGSMEFQGENILGEPVKVRLDGMLKEPVGGPEGLMLPMSFHWVSLGSPETLISLRGAEQPAKTASAIDPTREVRISVDRAGVVTLQGQPLDKVASSDLTLEDAEFLLAGLGIRPADYRVKLGEAARLGRTVALQASWALTPLAESRKLASKAVLPPLRIEREQFFKIAEVVQDPLAVDAVLSLGLLTDDNVGSVLNHLPPLEEALERLCDLLFAARLGLKELDVDALERGIKGVDVAVSNLKEIAFVMGPQNAASAKAKQPKV